MDNINDILCQLTPAQLVALTKQAESMLQQQAPTITYKNKFVLTKCTDKEFPELRCWSLSECKLSNIKDNLFDCELFFDASLSTWSAEVEYLDPLNEINFIIRSTKRETAEEALDEMFLTMHDRLLKEQEYAAELVNSLKKTLKKTETNLSKNTSKVRVIESIIGEFKKLDA